MRHHGRTAREYATGHKTKLPVACLGETVLWRKKRTIADLNKHDVEYSEGVFLGTSGMSSEFVLGTPQGVVRSRDVRVLADDGSRWNLKLVMQFGTPFEQYVDPTEQLPTLLSSSGALSPTISSRRRSRRSRPHAA